jgi:antitoxin component of MazEF toxin-antitoxin module
MNMQETTIVSQWGNSKGIRIPVEVMKKARINLNDRLFFEVDENKRIILTRTPSPKPGTLEYLFKDYTEGKFQTEPIDLGEPVGNEKW